MPEAGAEPSGAWATAAQARGGKRSLASRVSGEGDWRIDTGNGGSRGKGELRVEEAARRGTGAISQVSRLWLETSYAKPDAHSSQASSAVSSSP